MPKLYCEPSLYNMKVGQIYASKMTQEEWVVYKIDGEKMCLRKISDPTSVLDWTKDETFHYLDLVVNT